ncbi:MAG: hypothetical protein ACRC1T_03290 [Clostridium chrysemydis]|uniref:hypothetical protein n=1 Tax=Clostridium chrysemydis TaxID=2665504 RepID=UPI003F3133C6
MKNLTKISAFVSLLIVLALPLATNAATTIYGLYWPSSTSVSRSNIYAYAETRGDMLTVESIAQRNSDLYTYAHDKGVYWSKISVVRPEFSGTVVNVGRYWDSQGLRVIYQPDSTTSRSF